jgi:hypothetical protein
VEKKEGPGCYKDPQTGEICGNNPAELGTKALMLSGKMNSAKRS